MAYNSEISWTNHTLNGWHGCTKVSAGCRNCYAETLSKRWGRKIWGPQAERMILSDANWKKPLTWDKQARAAGRQDRVFAFSMADVFEDRRDLDAPRQRFFQLVEDTPNLMWLILTKRPELMNTLTPEHWGQMGWPDNTCAMTSVENQEQADIRIPYLLQVPAPYLALSMEPLLGEVILRADYLSEISWVITGGESGHGARPMHPAWVRSIRDQCVQAGVAFHFKQHGEFVAPVDYSHDVGIREIVGSPRFVFPDGQEVYRVGKKSAGRTLDGRTWDEMPFDHIR